MHSKWSYVETPYKIWTKHTQSYAQIRTILGNTIPILQLDKRLHIIASKAGWSSLGEAGWAENQRHLLLLLLFWGQTSPSFFPMCSQQDFLHKLTWKQLIYCFVQGMQPRLQSRAPQTPLTGLLNPKKGFSLPPAPPVQCTLLLLFCFYNLSPCKLLPNRSQN